MRRTTKILMVLMVVLLVGQTVMAEAKVEIEGVSFKRTLEAGGVPLELRGYGLLRYMVFIKAYVGALYVAPDAGSTDVLAPVAKRLELEYFHAIKGEEFDRATRIKIADNVTPFQFEKLQPRIEQLGALYQDVQPGDRYSLTFLPGQGTELALNGKALGTIPGKDFARALFGVWLGADPIDDDFRDVLLGV